MYRLHTNRLSVEIPLPGEGLNNTCRFDRAGFITSILLDGIHELCTAEPDNPGSGGVGLCSEIKCDALSVEAGIGEQFSKFGVGLLTKPDEKPYNFMNRYECEPFETECDSTDTTAIFITKPKACNNYGLAQKKTITVCENILTVAYEAENTGDKPLELNEYCHNFVTIDQFPTGPEYTLRFPTASFSPGKKPLTDNSALILEGNTFTYTGYSATPALALVESGEISDKQPCRWELTHSKSPVSIKEEVSFQPAMILIWTVDHIISAEVYHTFRLSPGEKHSWSRKWIFENEAK